jgi:hypothetical protein
MLRLSASPPSPTPLWRSLVALALASAIGPLAACNHETDERLGIDKKARAEWDPKALDSEGELEKAVTVSAAEVAKKLGSHRLSQSAKMQLQTGAKKSSLEEKWKFEIDGKGGVHANHENDHGFGFETLVVDGSIYARPLYGRYVRRAIEGDEIERLQAEQMNVLSGYLQVLGRFAERKEGGAVTHLGRPAHKVLLSLAGSPSRLRDKDPNHVWRKNMKVSALSGEVIVDDASGLPLKAQLDATYTTQRQPLIDDSGAQTPRPGEIQVVLAYRGDVEDVGVVPALTAPSDFVANANRPRPMLDRQELLEGLVTPSPATGGGGK